jgi:hypothetical protein
VITPAPFLSTTIEYTLLADNAIAQRAAYSFAEAHIMKFATEVVGGTPVSIVDSRAHVVASIEASGVLLKVKARLELVGAVSRKQIHDAIVMASTAHHDNVTLDVFHQYAVFELELPGHLIDFDTGKGSSRIGAGVVEQQIASALYASAADVFMDNSTVEVVAGPRHDDWRLCTSAIRSRCCGDTKCWSYESPANCAADCDQICWADLIGDSDGTSVRAVPGR